MAYPNSPPSTDARVHAIASTNQRVRVASTIGINNRSGGIGKTELSRKEITTNNQKALG